MPSIKDALLAAFAAAGAAVPSRVQSPTSVAPGAVAGVDDVIVSVAQRSGPADSKHGIKTVLMRTSGGKSREVTVVYGPSQSRDSESLKRRAADSRNAARGPVLATTPPKSKSSVQRELSTPPQLRAVSPPKVIAPVPSHRTAAPAIEVAAGARCLVAHYPDAPRSAADYGDAAGLQVQLATSQAADVHDVTIGLDFGTSTAKVVVTDASLEQSFAVPLCTGEAFDAYLMPSRVFERSIKMADGSSEVAYSLRDGAIAHRDLKLGLLAQPNSQGHQERVVAFLGLVLRSVRAWLFEEHAAVYRRVRIAWRVAIGLPAATVLNNELVPLLHNLVTAAWRVAGLQADVTQSCIRLSMQESLTSEELDLEVSVLPEIAAQIYGFVVSQRFDRKAANRFVMVDIGAGTIDSALFRVLPPKQGRWSFEFFTAVVQPFGVANLHAHRVSWWERLLAIHRQADHLRNQLTDTKFATDMELSPPATYLDYFKGVSIQKMRNFPSPDEQFFQTQVMTQVRGQTMWRAWKDSLLPKDALTGVPIFVCGGGSRMSFYSRINDEIGKMPGCSWLSAEPWNLGFPEDLHCESTDEAHFDRLSVAYGLSRLNLGSVAQAPPIPSIEVPQQSWTDRYIDKDAC